MSYRPHTTAGFAPVHCVKCHKLLLYGMFVGALRCSSCKTDNVRNLDELQKLLDTYKRDHLQELCLT